VVTSRTAAALQDVINTAGRRWAGCRLFLFDVRVQGAQAAPEIAAAIDVLSKHGPAAGIDAIIVTRGGGSMEDLWAFNEREVADAVFRCPLPVVAAIGHETDTTIAELVADVRCATPTQAAMTLIPDRAALDDQLDQSARRLSLLVGRHVQHARHRVDAAARHPMFRRPQQTLAPLRDRLEQSARQLTTLVPQRVQASRDRLEAMSRHLESIGPKNVLQRGYSYTLGADGHVLRSTKDAPAGAAITTVLVDGQVHSRVEGDAPSSISPPHAPRRRKNQRRTSAKDDGPRLF